MNTDKFTQGLTRNLSANRRWRDVPRLSDDELKARNAAEDVQKLAEARAKANCKTCLDLGFLRADLPFNHPDFGKAVPCPDCRTKAVKATTIQKLRSRSQLRGDLLDENFAKLIIRLGENDEPIAAAKEIMSKWAGWLLLSGDYGVGKSAILAAMVNDAIENNVDALYFTAPDLLDLLRPGAPVDYQTTMNNLKNIKVLVIDEMDKIAKKSDDSMTWPLEKMFQLLNSRYTELGSLVTALAMNGNPVVLWRNNANGYLFSRAKDERARIFHMGGKDKRPMAGRLKGYAQRIKEAVIG